MNGGRVRDWDDYEKGRAAFVTALILSALAVVMPTFVIKSWAKDLDSTMDFVTKEMKDFKEKTDSMWDELVEIQRHYGHGRDRRLAEFDFLRQLEKSNGRMHIVDRLFGPNVRRSPQRKLVDNNSEKGTDDTVAYIEQLRQMHRDLTDDVYGTATTGATTTTTPMTQNDAAVESSTAALPPTPPTTPPPVRVLMQSEKCPRGPPGPPGIDGIDGVPGMPGHVGASGASSVPAASLTSEKCIVCPIGPPGPPGPPGKAGVVGPPGEPGYPGINRGPPGPRGFAGDPGEPGTDGVRGPDGKPGMHGVRWLKGVAGEKGAVGLVGEPGLAGPTGPDGLPGDRGFPGASGFAGALGNPGPDGPDGPQGDEGLAGDEKHYCPCPERSSTNVLPSTSQFTASKTTAKQQELYVPRYFWVL